MEKTVKAKAKYIRITPRKTRLLVDMIRNTSVNEAEAILFSSPQRSRNVLLKLLRSAVANAKDVFKTDTSHLFIKEIKVDGGPMLKRWRARARGGIGKIEKKTSHITIVLGISEEEKKERFLIVKKKKNKKEAEKESKKNRIKKADTSKPDSDLKSKNQTVEKQVSKKGVVPKIFNRKSI